MEADHWPHSRGCRGHPDPGPPRALWGGAVGWAQDGCPGRWGQAGRMHCPCWAGGPGAVGTPLSVTFPAKGFTLGQLTAPETLHIVLGCSRLPVGRCAGGGPCPVDVFRRWTEPLVPRHRCLDANISTRLPAASLASPSPACRCHHRAPGPWLRGAYGLERAWSCEC